MEGLDFNIPGQPYSDGGTARRWLSNTAAHTFTVHCGWVCITTLRSSEFMEKLAYQVGSTSVPWEVCYHELLVVCGYALDT